MGSSEGSQFLSEYPAGIRCLRASASVALAGFAGGGAAFLEDELGRAAVGRADVVGRAEVGGRAEVVGRAAAGLFRGIEVDGRCSFVGGGG